MFAGTVTSLPGAESNSVTIHAAKPAPPDETPGPRPYEMVRAARKPPHVPLIDFDSLDGWQVECAEGAVADLIGSQKQRVWESPVGRLVYPLRGRTEGRNDEAPSGASLLVPAVPEVGVEPTRPSRDTGF